MKHALLILAVTATTKGCSSQDIFIAIEAIVFFGIFVAMVVAGFLDAFRNKK